MGGLGTGLVRPTTCYLAFLRLPSQARDERCSTLTPPFTPNDTLYISDTLHGSTFARTCCFPLARCSSGSDAFSPSLPDRAACLALHGNEDAACTGVAVLVVLYWWCCTGGAVLVLLYWCGEVTRFVAATFWDKCYPAVLYFKYVNIVRVIW